MSLADINHLWSSDISTSSTGDLGAVTGVTRGQQRILRRLLTNPGDYLFQPTYGAGLPQAIGDPLDIGKLTALIRSQVLLEDSVASVQSVSVVAQTDASTIAVNIKYTAQPSKAATELAFTVSK